MSIKKLIHNKQFIIGIIILICATSAAIGYYKYVSYYPSTDDAYIKAYIVNIAPKINGPVDSTNVTNNEYVKKGTLLFTIVKKPYQLAVNKAKTDLLLAKQNVKLSKSEAQVAQVSVNEANANYLYSEQTYKRDTYLNKKHIISDQIEDNVRRNFNVSKEKFISALSVLKQEKLKIDVANSTVKAANTELNIAKLNLSYTKIYAPADGYVSNFHLAAGEYINTGEQLFAFIESDQWWIKANFKETDLKRIKPGQDVNVYIDMYGKNIPGKVQSIAYGSGSTYSLLPPENATGNWVKVTQRFPVRILVKNNNPNSPLRVGSTVNVTVNTVS
jgi:membrane fusion protein, multidrug efflux system